MITTTMSTTRNSSYKLKGMVTLLYRYRSSNSSPIPTQFQSYRRDFFSSKLGFGGSNNMSQEGLRFVSGSAGEADTRNLDFNSVVKEIRPPVQSPSPPSKKTCISTWFKWLLGTVLSILLPFWKQKWEGLRQIEGKVEKVVEEAEVVAEVVEQVATAAEKLSTEVANQLPENSMIKEAALDIEHISNVTATDAQLTENLIHKVEDVKQDLKDLETMVDPIIDHIIKVEVV